MPGRSVLFMLFMLACAVPVFAQENITITTYYPSPYGSYNDLNIHRDLFVKDRSNSAGPQATLSNTAGNLTITSDTAYHQLMFNDTGVMRPFCYLQSYGSSGNLSYCEPGYIAVNYLSSSKIPQVDVDSASGSHGSHTHNTSLAPSGFIVCLRGWE